MIIFFTILQQFIINFWLLKKEKEEGYKERENLIWPSPELKTAACKEPEFELAKIGEI